MLKDYLKKKINMIPDWIKVEIYNKTIEIQEQMTLREQEGIIVISKEQAYFQHNDEIYEISKQKE